MSAAARRRERLVLVSDLHMATDDAPGGDPFADDRAFARLLEALAGGPGPARLVLLGDTFDLVLAGEGGLAAVAAAHPAVFATLGAFAAAGHGIDVVPGNHDSALLRPAVQQRLRELVGAPLDFHPWIFHLPGVLYAEHGQQQHAINHFRAVLGGPSAPPGLRLDRARVRCARLRRRHSGARGAALRGATMARALAQAGAGAMLPAGHTSRRRHAHRLREQAQVLGLPSEVLVELDRRAAARPLRALRGGDFMAVAAQRIAGVLTEAGATTPFYAFGHTHVAADRPLAGPPPGARYLNAGTWSAMVRTGRDGAQDRRRWIEIEHGAGLPPTAALRRWEDGP